MLLNASALAAVRVANQLTFQARKPKKIDAFKLNTRVRLLGKGGRHLPCHPYGTSLAATHEPRQCTKTREEQPWRSWYKSPTWKAIKRHRLAQEPNCSCCAQEGRTVIAAHVDHVEPHLGEWFLFAKYENTQSLCAHHYNSKKRSW